MGRFREGKRTGTPLQLVLLHRKKPSMADMYGTLASNWFRVKDVTAFKAWLEKECSFSCDIEFAQDDGKLLIHGGGMYPRALPERVEATLEDEDECDAELWDAQKFARALRDHLA